MDTFLGNCPKIYYFTLSDYKSKVLAVSILASLYFVYVYISISSFPLTDLTILIVSSGPGSASPSEFENKREFAAGLYGHRRVQLSRCWDIRH